MPAVSFTGLAIVAAVAFAVPFVLGLAPRVRLPSVVLEIVAGIVIGPDGLKWVRVDLPIGILALLGLAFLLFLAGLEIKIDRLRGRVLRVTGLAFALSFALALVISVGFGALGLVTSLLLVAIILSATALGVVIPILKDAGEVSSDFGQLVVAAATIAEFAAIILLSLFFSRQASGTGQQVVLLGLFALLALALVVAVGRAERSMRLTGVLLRLQDTTAQIRVRGAFILLAVFAALAERLGLEVILGAFMAGVILTLGQGRDVMMTHPLLRTKLEAIGFGVFIPVFFVSSGLQFNLAALAALVVSPSTLVRVPLFLGALFLIRAVPALLYWPRLGGRRTAAAALLQATSLSFIVAATGIGRELGLLNAASAAALVAAGLLSVLLFPLAALTLLRGGAQPAAVARPTSRRRPANGYRQGASAARGRRRHAGKRTSGQRGQWVIGGEIPLFRHAGLGT